MKILDKYLFATSRFPNAGLIRLLLTPLTMYQVYQVMGKLQGFTSVNPQADALFKPGVIVRFLHLPVPISNEYIGMFALVFYLVGLLAATGVLTRVTVFLYALGLIYITDIQAARGFFNHEFSLSSQVLLILAFIPGTVNLSFDRIFTWWRNRKTNNSPLWDSIIGSPEYVWGIKLIIILLACTYFTAGLSKVRYGGMAWLDGSTLAHYLDGSASPHLNEIRPMYISPADVPDEAKWKDGFGIYSYSYGNRQAPGFWGEVGLFLAEHRALISALAVGVVIFEMIAPIALLFGGWVQVLYLIGAIAMHRSIGVLMNLSFKDYQLLCLLLIDWPWVYTKMAGVWHLIKLKVGFNR